MMGCDQGQRRGNYFLIRMQKRRDELSQFSTCGKQVDGDVSQWKPRRQAKQGCVESGDQFSFGHAECEVALGHLGEDIQEVARNKDQELTGDRG